MAAKPPPPKPGQKKPGKPAAAPGLPFPGAKPLPGQAGPASKTAGKTPAKPMKKTGK